MIQENNEENYKFVLKNNSMLNKNEIIDNIIDTNYTEVNIISSKYYEYFKSKSFHNLGTEEKTNIIPNLLYKKNKIKSNSDENNTDNKKNENNFQDILKIIKDLFYIISPLFIILLIIYLIIKCKQNNFIGIRRMHFLNERKSLSELQTSKYSNFNNTNINKDISIIQIEKVNEVEDRISINENENFFSNEENLKMIKNSL